MMKCLRIFNHFFIRFIALSAVGVWCHATASAEDIHQEPCSIQVAYENEAALRGPILDRHGEVIAENRALNALYAKPQELGDIDSALDALTQIFPSLDGNALKKTLSDGAAQRTLLMDNLSEEQATAVSALEFGGLELETEVVRVYSRPDLFAPVIGLVDPTNEGTSGIERFFNPSLTTSEEPLDLSLDSRLQRIVAEELNKTIQHFTAKSGTAVLLDVDTSEVLSMVSITGLPHKNQGCDTATRSEDYAVSWTYEVGSLFKVFTAASILEAKVTTPDELIDVSEPVRIDRFTIRDYYPHIGLMNLGSILSESSNVGISKLALRLEPREQKAFLSTLGLLSIPTIQLPEVASPEYPSYWGKIQLAASSYGYGVAASPLQITNAFAAVVNGGTYHPASLLKANEAFVPRSGTRVLSKQNSQAINSMLEEIVSSGTSTNAAVQMVSVGGKTGTADKPSAEHKDAKVASFIGAFPMERPKYALMILVDEPKPQEETYGYATGGWVAAPTFSRIVERIACDLLLNNCGSEATSNASSTNDEATTESLNTEDFEGALASLRTAFINAGGGSDTFSDYMLDEELLWNVSAEFHDGSGVPQSKAVSLIFEIVAVGEKDATWAQFPMQNGQLDRQKIIDEAYAFMGACLLEGQCLQPHVSNFPSLSVLYETYPSALTKPSEPFSGFHIDGAEYRFEARSQFDSGTDYDMRDDIEDITEDIAWDESVSDCWMGEIAWGEQPVVIDQAPDIDFESLWCAADQYGDLPIFFPEEELAANLEEAAQGNADAQLWIARYHHERAFQDGELIDEATTEALKWYQEAANSDLSDAHLAYAFVLEAGHLTEKNPEEAFFWVQMVAEEASAATLFELAGIYFHGDFGNQDYDKALQLYTSAAKAGHAQSQLALGYMSEKGYAGEPDFDVALDWYLRAWKASKDLEEQTYEYTFRLRRICTLTQAKICKTLDLSVD